MVKPELVEERPVTMGTLRKELESIQSKYKELNFRSARTLEHLQEFLTEKEKTLSDLQEKLQKLDIPRLKEEYICKIVDLLPKTVDDLKVIMQGYTVTVNNDNLKKIVDTVNSVIGKK
ncbi:MAG: hypothetical protein QF632_03385 [Candidatus Woesearchaeota archaeon]|jgi:DNA-directed RNA polymerase subunit F|nr:hypothetical protein [Candidatus Woesearchaeota archaeon]